MKGGKIKPVEEHLVNGTYRPCLHSKILQSDETAITEMKEELYKAFLETTKKFNKADIEKQPESYKLLNTIMIEQIKAFHSIARTPVVKNVNRDLNDKDGFKE